MPISYTTPTLTNTAQVGASQTAVQTAALANGGYVVAWESNFGGPTSIFFQRFDGAGTPVGATTQVVNPANQTMTLRDIAVTDDGAFSILTQGSVSSVIFDPRLLVYSYSGDTGAPTAPPVALNLTAFGFAPIGAQLVADPGTSPSALVVAASVTDIGFFTDLVRASVTTAGAITSAPSVLNNNYPTGTTIIELVNGSSGQQFALTTGAIVDTVGGTIGQGVVSDFIQLAPGVLVAARPTASSPAVTLTMLTGPSGSGILSYASGLGVTGTNTPEVTTTGAQAFDIELLDLGNGRILIVWVADGGDSVPAGSPPFIDGVMAQVYDVYAGQPEGAPVRIRELGLGANDLTLQSVTLSVDLMADGRVAVGMSYPNGLAGMDVFTSVLDPRIAGVLVAATAGADILAGTSFNDTFTGVGTGDSINGGVGLDTVMLDPTVARTIDLENPAAVPGNGVTLVGIENLTGGNLADDLRGNDEWNVLNGGNGNDTLQGRGGNDTLLGGGDGADVLFGGAGADQMDGGVGIDTLDGGEGSDLMFGGNDSDRLRGGIGDDTLQGGDLNDILRGDDGDDSLAGDAGSDTISGGQGDDLILGGAGSDVLRANEGADTLFGGADNDLLIAGSSAALIDGGIFTDTLQLSGPFLPGTTGIHVDLAGVYDTLGLDGALTRMTADIVGVENVTGSTGNDFIVGDGASNVLRGGLGDDTLVSGQGNDTLFGGGGADVFVFTSAAGAADVLRDIALGTDDIGLLDGAFGDINAANIASRLTVNATGTVGATAVAQLVFDNAGAGFGQLFFDADGNGAGAAVLIATLTPTTGTLVALSATDFLFL